VTYDYDDAKPTPTAPTDASARSRSLRRRVLEALAAGDRRGDWRGVAELLDLADETRALAERQHEIGRELLEAVDPR